jgi:hypothetical protein
METHMRETYSQLKALLEQSSESEIRVVGIDALRSVVGRATKQHPRDVLVPPTDAIIRIRDIGLEIVGALCRIKNTVIADRSIVLYAFEDEEAFNTDWMEGVLEFLWWLERTGLAVPLLFDKKRDPGYSSSIPREYPSTLRLTQRGRRLIAGSQDNPLLPNFLERIRERCPGLPEEVIVLLVDARACIDHSLLRAAVALMGVAYEITIAEAVNRLHTLGLVDRRLPEKQAGEKLKTVLAAIRDDKITALQSIPDTTPEAAKRAAENAYMFADTLRLRRNEASHLQPTHDFDHTGETEEFLVSAGRHLPGLWSVVLQ